MAEEGQPAWLSSGNSGSTGNSGAVSNTTSARSTGDVPYKKAVQGTLLFLNLGFMVFMAATGALGIGASTSVTDTGAVFVGIYMILFAAIVFIYEISQVLPFKALDDAMKLNFGFLYGIIGKGLFIMFMGALSFGLSDPQQLALACGILTCAWGPVLIVFYFKFPEYFDLKEKYNPQ